MVHAFETRTSADGVWQVPNKRDWTIGILLPDGLPLYVDVYCVFADGYEPEIRNPVEAWLGEGLASEHNRAEREMPLELRLERKSSAPVTEPRPARAAPQSSPCGITKRN